MNIPKNNTLLPNARDLRANMTPQEKKLWYQFFREYPVKIYKQRIIDSYIADFYCAKAKLVIEIDGSQHATEKGYEYDTKRTEILNKYGLKVIRFTNIDIDNDFIKVCEKIDYVIKGAINDQL